VQNKPLVFYSPELIFYAFDVSVVDATGEDRYLDWDDVVAVLDAGKWFRAEELARGTARDLAKKLDP